MRELLIRLSAFLFLFGSINVGFCDDLSFNPDCVQESQDVSIELFLKRVNIPKNTIINGLGDKRENPYFTALINSESPTCPAGYISYGSVESIKEQFENEIDEFNTRISNSEICGYKLIKYQISKENDSKDYVFYYFIKFGEYLEINTLIKTEIYKDYFIKVLCRK